MRELLAVVLAALASSSYALSTALQALAARAAPSAAALRGSLLVWLVRRRVWLVGTAVGFAGWALQAGALALGSLGLVQPALGLGLIALLVFGVRLLGEPVGAREVGGAVAIAIAVAVLAWAAPPETGSFTRGGQIAVATALLLLFVVPYLLRAVGAVGGLVTSVVAGLGWAAVGVGTALVDGALADGRIGAGVAWGVAAGAAGFASLVLEMSALQSWPATRAVPISYGLEMILPAAAAPFLTSVGPAHTRAFVAALALATAGAILLGGSKTVADAGDVALTAP